MNSDTFFKLAIGLALLILLFYIIFHGFSLLFIILLILWAIYLYFLWNSTKKESFSIKNFSIVLVIIFVVSFIFILIPNKNKKEKSVKTSTSTEKISNKENANGYYLNQTDVTTQIFGADTNGDGNGNEARAVVSPLTNIGYTGDSNAKLVEFEIRNIKLNGNKIGNVVTIAPTHIPSGTTCFGWYLEDCHNPINPNDIKDAGSTIKYRVVDGKAQYLDEVSNSDAITPNFRVILTDLGEFDHDKIMKEEGSFSSKKIPEYVNLNKGDLGNELEYEIYMKFDDGTDNSWKVVSDL